MRFPVLAATNPRVKRLRRLTTSRNARDDQRRFVLEGAVAVLDALAAGARPDEVFVRAGTPLDDRFVDAVVAAGTDAFTLDAPLFDAIAPTEHPQPVLAVASTVDRDLSALASLLDADPESMVVVAAGVAEPGNLGTIVRTAAAAGAAAVVTTRGSVDPYNPKAIRASAGALLRIFLVRDADPDELARVLGDAGVARIGLDGRASDTLDDLDLTGPVALVAGNEAHGLGAQEREWLDRTVAIPLSAGVESLNVATALAVAAFEAARQRRLGR